MVGCKKNVLSLNTEHLVYTAKNLTNLFRRLYKVGAVKVDTDKGFAFKHHEKFPEAPLSPSYISLRVPENNGVLEKDDVETIASFMLDLLRKNNTRFDGICGVPRAGEPFAKALQEWCYRREARVPELISLSKEEGAEGRKVHKLIRNQGLPRGCSVLLVDDLITTSLSKLEAIEVLRREGYRVEHCIVLIDREQGGRAAMAQHGVNTHSIFNFTAMFLYYRDTGLITPEQYDKIMAYKEIEKDLLAA